MKATTSLSVAIMSKARRIRGRWPGVMHLSWLRRIVSGHAFGKAAGDNKEVNKLGAPQTGTSRATFLETIKGTKFADSPAIYFIVYDYDGVAVYHPDPARQGRNRSDAAADIVLISSSKTPTPFLKRLAYKRSAFNQLIIL
ncbi:MAG TPA: hypothetical protein VNR65_00125 [Geobacterales bacterium]|nr:hypothetical protein [Geobacterales bacterium]